MPAPPLELEPDREEPNTVRMTYLLHDTVTTRQGYDTVTARSLDTGPDRTASRAAVGSGLVHFQL